MNVMNILSFSDGDYSGHQLHTAGTHTDQITATSHLCMGQCLTREIFSSEDLFCPNDPANQPEGAGDSGAELLQCQGRGPCAGPNQWCGDTRGGQRQGGHGLDRY